MEHSDQISILMKARDIPDNTVVTKKMGTYLMTLKQGLTVYSDTKGEKPMKIEGSFLLGDRGAITQIKPDTVLAMSMSVTDLYFWLQDNVENIEDDPDFGK